MTIWAAAVLAAAATWAILPPSGGGTRRRLRRAVRGGVNRNVVVPGPVLLDLVTAVLTAGASPSTGLRLIAVCLAEHDPLAARALLDLAACSEAVLPTPVLATSPPWVVRLDSALTLARDAGIGAAPLLQAAAEDERRERSAAARAAAARLGVRVVLPAGLCLLPAFVLLTVVPLLLGLLT